MWLKLNLDGIKLYFKVKGYKKSTDSNWYDEWCTVELNVQSENWLNYSQSGDLLLACEVEEILLDTDINTLSPIQALMLLGELKEKIKSEN